MSVEEKYQHVINAYNEYKQRFDEYWQKAIEKMKSESYPVDGSDEGWWYQINEEMDALGWHYGDIEDKYGVYIEHDEITITVVDSLLVDGENMRVLTEDGEKVFVMPEE